MKWQELSEQHCSVARSLAVVGDRWTLMIVRDLFLGAQQFEQLRRSLKISRTVLTDRLNLLEAEGVVRKRPYQEKPTRYRYLLTTKGMDLYPIIMTLVSWGDKYYAGEEGPPVLYQHRSCGHDFKPVLTCSECREDLNPLDTRVHFAEFARHRETGSA
ncbi:MAG: helix-turn-helix transcriptional regulator [Halioglobus sp.]|nr:helix-turn-helix transcriptional regulator [Halioglobus sp.]